MRQSKIAVAVATAAALVGSIAAITPSPQASASSNTQSSISRAAVSGSNGDGIIGKDCRKAIINDAKLRAEIVASLVKAGFSSADAVALAPRIAAEMAKGHTSLRSLAEALGLPRKTLHDKLRKHGLDSGGEDD